MAKNYKNGEEKSNDAYHFVSASIQLSFSRWQFYFFQRPSSLVCYVLTCYEQCCLVAIESRVVLKFSMNKREDRIQHGVVDTSRKHNKYMWMWYMVNNETCTYSFCVYRCASQRK